MKGTSVGTRSRTYSVVVVQCYSRGLPAGSPGPREGHASEWTTPDQIGTTHHTLGLQ